MDQRLFLDFEYVFAISVALVIILMYLFYIKYPYGSDKAMKSERSGEARGSSHTTQDDGNS